MGEILDKFSEHVKQFEVEKVTRLQRETQTLKRVGDEVFRIQQKIGSERAAREAAIILMKDDFIQTTKSREKARDRDEGPRGERGAAGQRAQRLHARTARRAAHRQPCRMTRRVHVHYLAVGGVTHAVLPLSLLLERADRPHPSTSGALVGWQSYAVAAR